MKFKLFGFTISNETNKLSSTGARAKREISKEKIANALQVIENKQLKYSEYRLQKLSGLSLNTIKKYRDFIQAEREKIRNRLI